MIKNISIITLKRLRIRFCSKGSFLSGRRGDSALAAVQIIAHFHLSPHINLCSVFLLLVGEEATDILISQ
jgi:hypothetical protein